MPLDNLKQEIEELCIALEKLSLRAEEASKSLNKLLIVDSTIKKNKDLINDDNTLIHNYVNYYGDTVEIPIID